MIMAWQEGGKTRRPPPRTMGLGVFVAHPEANNSGRATLPPGMKVDSCNMLSRASIITFIHHCRCWTKRGGEVD